MVDNLDLHPRIIQAVHKSKLKDNGDILSLSGPDIERFTNLSASDVNNLQKTVARAVPKLPIITAHDLLKGNCPNVLHIRKLSVGCRGLDAFLEGGILTRGITEIVGESGSGKTQLCMQLCLTVQLPETNGGLNGGAVYICTEDAFPNKRLGQMISFMEKKYKDVNFGDKIFIEHAADRDGLLHCINRRIPLLLARGAVKLIIIDSIAALFRLEYSLGETIQRAKSLNSFGSLLHKMSNQYNIPVVCVNQVSASFADKGKKTIPALGLTWANLVTTRIQLCRTQRTTLIRLDSGDNDKNYMKQYETITRTMEILFSPHLPNRLCHYIVNEKGIEGISVPEN